MNRFRLQVAGVLLLCLPATAIAQHVNSSLWTTNATVWATALSGNTLYIGGNFTYVGPYTGGAVLLDATSAAVPAGFPQVHGIVKAVAKDGSGGWFIGGNFDSVGGVARANAAHISSDFTVTSWNPNANGAVLSLAVSGTVVVAGGEFTAIGGQPRQYIAELDVTTGFANTWNPVADSHVYVVAVEGSLVYACGFFTTIGGQSRGRIAAINLLSGTVTGWNPNANGVVYTLLVSGTTVYAGGAFTTIGGAGRNYVAALDATTGAVKPWNPNPDGYVYALALGGSTVYVGGAFSTIGGLSRPYIGAINAAGSPTSWNPGANGNIFTLAVSGSTVYAGGPFTTIGGLLRNHIAAVDPVTGIPTSWDPNATSTVHVVATNASTVFAGGAFTSITGKNRNYLAALDVTTGVATSWNPNTNNSVSALLVSGTNVYAGGSFSAIGGAVRNGIAALDATTGTPTSWNPNCSGSVSALAKRGPTIYAGGAFGFIGGQIRTHIAALDSTTGFATSFDPNADSYVHALAVNGSTVYAGGTFTLIGTQYRNRIAALNATTGFATSWNPDASSTVLALAVSGARVYAGGAFTTMGGGTHNFLAAIDVSTGVPLSWGPNPDQTVYALAVEGSTIYAGGSFINVSGSPRRYVAALSSLTGLPTTWNPNLDGYAYTLSVGGGTVYAGGSFITVGGVQSWNLAGISTTFGITGLHPTRGGNDPVTVVVRGAGFQSGATATLTRLGQAIAGSPVTVAADGESLATTFDLRGKPQGTWNVIITNPDTTSTTLPQGFTIEPEEAPQLRVSVLGPALIRSSRRTSFDLVIENPGNVDAFAVPLWITGVPLDATLELDFSVAGPPQAGGEPDWSRAPISFTSPGGMYVPVVIPRVPPGTTVRRIFLTIPPTHSAFNLGAAVTPPWVDGNKFRACLTGGGVITAPACMGAQLTAINAYLASNPQLQALSGIGVWAKIAWQCEGATTEPAALAKAEQILDFMVQPIEVPGSAITACSDVLPPRWRDSLVVTIVGSIDPNDKLGAHGTLAVHQAIPYSIRFENLSTATAPAQQVVISDPLDLAKLDPSTVSLDVITFGTIHIVPPPGLKSYATQVDLRPARNLLVNVSAGLDPFTGVLTWYFSSIDPATGQPPTDPLAGFLPPNHFPPEGEGSVLFTVMPRSTLASGAQISNGASITFDENAPLNTPAWLNTLDAAPPASQVLPLAPSSNQPSVPVQWTASGSPPDLRDFTVYVSEDGAPYRVWRLNTTAVNDTLVPPGNHLTHTYAFYSVARDVNGNIEPAPGAADASTQSTTAVGDGESLQLALAGARPNPARGTLEMWFTLASREPATLEVIDVAGRRMVRRDVGGLGPGSHHITLATAPLLRPGLYFLRLIQGSRALSTRVVVIR